jgi:hypothetical protein
MTSLPVDSCSTQAVAKLYHERWEIDLSFRDTRGSMQQNAITLRSKKVDLVYQDVGGAFAVLQLHSLGCQSGGGGVWPSAL